MERIAPARRIRAAPGTAWSPVQGSATRRRARAEESAVPLRAFRDVDGRPRSGRLTTLPGVWRPGWTDVDRNIRGHVDHAGDRSYFADDFITCFAGYAANLLEYFTDGKAALLQILRDLGHRPLRRSGDDPSFALRHDSPPLLVRHPASSVPAGCLYRSPILRRRLNETFSYFRDRKWQRPRCRLELPPEGHAAERRTSFGP